MSYTSMVLSNGMSGGGGHQHMYTQHRGGPYNNQQQQQQQQHQHITQLSSGIHQSASAAHPSTTPTLSSSASSPSNSSSSATPIIPNQPLLPTPSLTSLLPPTPTHPPTASTFALYPTPPPDVIDTYTRYFAACRTRELTGHRKSIRCVRWNGSGSRLASGSGDGSVRVWELRGGGGAGGGVVLAGAEGVELKGHGNSVEFVCFNPARPDQLASASLDGTVKVWDTTTARCTSTVTCPGENITLAWSRDGSTLAVGNKDNAITLIDARMFTPLVTIAYPYEMNELDFATQHIGRPLYLLASTGRAQVEIIDATACITKAKAATATTTTNKPVRISSPPPTLALDNHAAPVYALATSADGRLIASGSTDAIVVIRDTQHLAPLCTLLRLDSPIRSVSFGGGGRLVAVGTEGGELEISVVDGGNGVRVWSVGLANEVVSVAFNPVQPLLAYSTDSTDRHCVHLFGCA